jgi:formiminotetrahydrofolate cyclodeaminase
MTDPLLKELVIQTAASMLALSDEVGALTDSQAETYKILVRAFPQLPKDMRDEMLSRASKMQTASEHTEASAAELRKFLARLREIL